MNKDLQTSVADANISAAMESETIQKNGVSPKPVRRILLRIAGNVTLLALLMFVVFKISAQRHPAEPKMEKVNDNSWLIGEWKVALPDFGVQKLIVHDKENYTSISEKFNLITKGTYKVDGNTMIWYIKESNAPQQLKSKVTKPSYHPLDRINQTIEYGAGLGDYYRKSPSNTVEPERVKVEGGNIVEPEMIKVEGGTFTMGCTSEQGSDCESDERPAHHVTLSSFSISKYEITQAQWKAIMDDNPSHFKGDNLPVESVGWNTVQEFIMRLNAATGKNYRLPTEAEWEYAARGGNQSRGYKYSGSNNLDEVAWFLGNSDKRSHPVGTKRANELGIYDMTGNVWEWCQDWYGGYSASNQQNPAGASYGFDRVDRGGGWRSEVVRCRITDRDDDKPDLRNINLGFRVVLP